MRVEYNFSCSCGKQIKAEAGFCYDGETARKLYEECKRQGWISTSYPEEPLLKLVEQVCCSVECLRSDLVGRMEWSYRNHRCFIDENMRHLAKFDPAKALEVEESIRRAGQWPGPAQYEGFGPDFHGSMTRKDLPSTKKLHEKDEDCTLDAFGSCTECGVYHGAPCKACGGQGFHHAECLVAEPAKKGELS